MESLTTTNTSATHQHRRTAVERWILGLEAVLAVAAYAGAIALLTGMIPMEGAMKDVPFASPILAGIALGLINGVVPTVAVVAELRGLNWAPRAPLAVGAALMGWIVVQIGFIGFTSWLQPAMFAWGAAIFVLGYVHLRHAD